MNQILVAVDGHPHASDVVDSAIQVAKSMSAKILLVFVIKGKGEPQGFKSAESYDENQYLRTTGPLMEKIKQSNLDVEEIWGGGDPKKFILKTAQSNGASMIVLGIHPRKSIGKIMAIGDVARNVIESSKVPVLVVP
jgi:nucleotide-binding universal stress UspA family protein